MDWHSLKTDALYSERYVLTRGYTTTTSPKLKVSEALPQVARGVEIAWQTLGWEALAKQISSRLRDKILLWVCVWCRRFYIRGGALSD